MRLTFGLAVAATASALLLGGEATARERVVTTTADGSDGRCDAHCTLREAVALTARDESVILPAGRYRLTRGELELGHSETILGAGARTTTIDAGNASRVLRVSGVGNRVSGVTITGGNADRAHHAEGGGIRVDVHGRLTLEDSAVLGNVAPRKGGGIFSAGDLRLAGSTVAGNRAGHAHGGPGSGGGIYAAAGGSAALENSTVSGNAARPAAVPSRGGGVLNAGDLVVNHLTIAFNSASEGGGLYASKPARSLSNTIIAGNSGGACAGKTSIVGHGNLDDDATCGLAGEGSFPRRDPLLAPLGDNGGETDTHALLPGSPAIDAGSRPWCRREDQRRVLRDRSCDIGAFEAQAPAPVLLDGNPLDLYSDGTGRLQLRVDGQPAGIFAAPDDNSADAGLAIKQGAVHFGLGVARTVLSPPHVTRMGTSRVISSQYAVGPDLLVSEGSRYDDGSEVVDTRYEIRSRSGASVTFRAGALADLSIGGDDTGAGVFVPAAPRFVGGRSRTGATAGLVERTPWLGYQAGDVAAVFGSFAAEGLTNTVTADLVDNAVGVEWQRTVEPGRPAVLEVSWRVDLASGTNTGTLRVVTRVVNDDGGAGGPGDFRVHVRSGGSEVPGSPRAGSGTGTQYTLAPGVYGVSADAVPGYSVSVGGDCAGDGSVGLAAGQTRTCTVTADDVRRSVVGSGPPGPGQEDVQLPPPVAGKNVNIRPVTGTVKIKLPGSRRFIVLEEGRQIPLGTIVDTRDGRAALVAASDTSGGTATAQFHGGIFRVRQTKGEKPITRLKLIERLRCTPARAAGTAARRRTRRRLWGDGSGTFRTDGRYSSATVRGTRWLVEDRCGSTLTKVTAGSVTVRDRVRRKTVIVRAGRRYVARQRAS